MCLCAGRELFAEFYIFSLFLFEGEKSEEIPHSSMLLMPLLIFLIVLFDISICFTIIKQIMLITENMKIHNIQKKKSPKMPLPRNNYY